MWPWCGIFLLLASPTNSVYIKNYLDSALSESYVDETSRFIASILMPICGMNNNIYQLNFLQLFFDPYSNLVMNRVLKYIAGASCGNKIVSNYSRTTMGSTSGTQYYVVFCNVLHEVSFCSYDMKL